jgi:hypothetical protein
MSQRCYYHGIVQVLDVAQEPILEKGSSKFGRSGPRYAHALCSQPLASARTK